MERTYWLEKWQRGDIGFHRSEVNPVLLEHFPKLTLPGSGRVFLPLCGKTRDIHWLLARGYRVAGAELVELAVEELFSELGVEPEISDVGGLKRYCAEGLTVFNGDIFDLSADVLGSVDAVYDRAALVALPAALRLRYVSHLQTIVDSAPQLLVTYSYDQRLVNGPPFSVDDAEVRRHYSRDYEVELLESVPTSGRLKGRARARQQVWLLAADHRASSS